VTNLKSPREIAKMRVSSQIVAECLALCRRLVAPGIRTVDLDEAVAALIRERGAESAFLGYHGFPAHICVSVNDEVVHGIPGGRRLKEGDIVSVDCGVRKDGYYGDSATTIPCGKISTEARRLVQICETALALAIEVVRPGEKLSSIARVIQDYVEGEGLSVVRKFVGHGIGSQMHEEPQVPNYVSPQLLENDVILKPGLALAIEPMVNQGTHEVRVKNNGWTVVTLDGGWSAHSEHTVVVTETGRDVLTRLPEEATAAGAA